MLASRIHVLLVYLQFLHTGCDSVMDKVYVSKVKGVNYPPCGRTKLSPCKTLQLGFDKLANGGLLYVDGTATDIDPYSCESTGRRLLVKKGFEMQSYNSQAQITCTNGIITQANEQNSFQITIKGIRFTKTPIDLEGTTAVFNDCVFMESSPALDIKISRHVSRYVLNISRSVFKNNSGCIYTHSQDNIGISMNLRDVSFQENSVLYVDGKPSSAGIVRIQGSRGTFCVGARLTSFWSNVTIMNNQGSSITNLWKPDQTNYNFPANKANVTNYRTSSFLEVDAYSAKLSFWQVNSHNNSGLRFLKTKCRNSIIRINESRFSDHVVSTNGGVIYMTSCERVKRTDADFVSVQNSIFTRNVAFSGGVMHIDVKKTLQLKIINSIILKSYGTSNGCVVCVGNPLSTRRRTGQHLVNKLFLAFSKVQVKECHLQQPKSYSSEHFNNIITTVYLAAKTILQANITNSEFSKNSNHDGSTIAIEHQSDRPKSYHSLSVFIFNTTFSGNISPRKVASVLSIHAFYPKTMGKSEAKIMNCNFRNNTGLAIMARNVPNLIIDKLNCNSTKGICLQVKNLKLPNTTIKIINSVFSKNNSPLEISIHDAKLARILLQRSIFTQNHINISHKSIVVFIGFKYEGNHSIDINSVELVLDEVNFTSNVLLRNSLFTIVGSKHGKLSTVIKNSLFKLNDQRKKDNRSIITKLIELRMPSDHIHHLPQQKKDKCTKYPVYDYSNTVTFQDVTFENNICYSSLLYIYNGKTSFQRCVFKDNFSHKPTRSSYIFVEIGSSSVEFHNSTFSQSRNKSFPRKSKHPLIKLPDVMPFVYFAGTGPFVLRGSNFTLDVSERLTKVLIIQNARNFSIDDKSNVICPVGSYINLDDISRVVPEECTINNCPIHIEYVTYVCHRCPVSTYSLSRGSFRGKHKTYVECFNCPFGGNCGSPTIKSKTTFWGYKSILHPEPQLNFTRCPERYCVYPKSGRNYTQFNYCNGNRAGIMCGACREGYTETMFNHHCRPSHQCNDKWFWVFSGVFSVAMVLYIVYQPSVTKILVRKILWFKEVNTDQTQHSQHHSDHGYSKIIFFFYQIATLFIINPEVLAHQHVIFSIVSLYNFDIEILDASSGCPFPGLNAVTKELFRSLQVFAAMAAVFVFYILHRFVFFISRKRRPYFAPYIAAIVEILLLGYERLGHTSLELLNCTPLTIDGRVQWRLFVDGNITCWVHWWQYALVAYNIIFVVPFLVVLWIGTSKLRRQEINALQFVTACFVPLPFLLYWLVKRLSKANSSINNSYQEMRKHLLEVMQGPFRCPNSQSRGALFWESILIGRRLVFLSLAFLIPSPMFRLLPMTLVAVAVLVHEVVVMPYKDIKANVLSVSTLSINVVIATINLCKSALVSFGISPKGKSKLHFYRLQILEVVLLCALPCGIIVLVVAALISQVVRLFINVYQFIFTANENDSTSNEIQSELVYPEISTINTPLLCYATQDRNRKQTK